MRKSQQDRLPSIDEWVSTLQHSHLHTIFVEGEKDRDIYKRLQEYIPIRVDIFVCSNRPKLLEIYEHRAEFSQLPVAFIADQDMYLFVGIPEEYNDIIWTAGYSIENDIYAGSRIIDDLLTRDERNDFHLVLNKIIEWFAFEVEQYKVDNKNRVLDINLSDNKRRRTNDETYILIKRNDESRVELDVVLCKNFKKPSQDLFTDIQDNYKLKVRGKTLFKLLNFYLNSKRRQPKQEVQYSESHLYDLGIKLIEEHPYMQRLITQINQQLGTTIHTI